MKDFVLVIFGYIVRIIYEKVFADRPKLVFTIEDSRGFNWQMPAGQPNIQLWQHSIHLCNWGKTPANNIVISHTEIPMQINISPHALRKMNTDRGANTITITSIAPRELITISYMDFRAYNSRATHTGVICNEGIGREIPLLVTRQPNKWVIRALLLFASIGIVATVLFCYFKLPDLCESLKSQYRGLRTSSS